MSEQHGLVGLLHRADWTRLCMSAEVSDGSTVLVAPGRRYRCQSADVMTGCDGGRRWELSPGGDDLGGLVHWVGGLEPPLPRLLCPAWLLEGSVLQAQGRVRWCGREAFDVAVTMRPGHRRGRASADGPPLRLRVLVDAELGILLRIAEPGWEPEVTELVSVEFDPVIDPDRFAPPPGSRVVVVLGEALGGLLGPAWWAAKTTVGLAAGALGAWIQDAPFRRAQRAADGTDFEAAISADEPTPDLSQGRVRAGPPVSDELLELLHAGGPAEFAATLHQWTGLGRLVSSVPTAARQAGFGGLGMLTDAISDLPATGHLISRVRVAGDGRYQIDHAYQPRRGPVTIACDGQRRWKVYSDKIITGPAEPPPRVICDLADPSWLLRCWLSGGAMIPAADPPAYRIFADRRHGDQSPALLFHVAVANIDADLRLVRRLTSYIGTRPVQRHELREVTTDIGDFRIKIPAHMRTVEEHRPLPA